MIFKKDDKEYKQLKELNENLIRIAIALEDIKTVNSEIKSSNEIILTYLSRIMFAEQEINKNTAFSNALKFLDSQYNSSDAIMSVEEIKQYYEGIRNELFVAYNEDYKTQVEAEEEGEDKENDKL